MPKTYNYSIMVRNTFPLEKHLQHIILSIFFYMTMKQFGDISVSDMAFPGVCAWTLISNQ